MQDGTTVATEPTFTKTHEHREERDWQVVDRALRGISARRAALDAEEARWLREAEILQIWKPLGMVSALDYMERVLGYAPRTGQERLRVARALGSLGGLETALASGDLAFSAVRELTRVVTPATEGAWIAAAIGKNLREVEELVADHQPGDGPDDPKTPNLRWRKMSLELSPQTCALVRQARVVLAEEQGTYLDDDTFMAVLARGAIEGRSASEPSGRAPYQIALTVCARCRQGWQHGGGKKIAVGAAVVERAECCAQHVGSIEGGAPVRAHQDVPPATVRAVWLRDHGRCRVPGCRSTRGLDVHHIKHRADGGNHDLANLVLVCGAHHAAHHDRRIEISGSAEDLVVRWPSESARASEPSPHRAHVGATDEGVAVLLERTEEALVQLGWSAKQARAAVELVAPQLPPDATLEAAIRAAIRKCPGPAMG